MKRTIGIIAALSMLLSMLVPATTALAYTTGSPPTEAQDGYVYLSVDADTIGGGYLYEPVKVPFTAGESLADITRAVADINSADNKADLLAKPGVQDAYGAAMATLTKLDATQDEVDNALDTLNAAMSAPGEPPADSWLGDGTQGNPYQISNAAQLEHLSDMVDNQAMNTTGVYFLMTADIQLDSSWVPIGTTSNMFSGSFDGGGHTLSYAFGSKALFGPLKGGSTVKNLNLYGEYVADFGLMSGYVPSSASVAVTVDNVNILSGTTIKKSGFMGDNGIAVFLVNISNCTVQSGVRIGYDAQADAPANSADGYPATAPYGTGPGVGSFVSGLCGTVTNCVSAATVYGQGNVGGIVGYKAQSMRAFTLSNCVFSGSIMATGNYVGGIVGGGYAPAPGSANTPGVSINNCYVTGDVSGANYVGGVFGGEGGQTQAWANGIGSIQNNHFCGTVSATAAASPVYVGGIIGYMRSLDCYNVITNNFFEDTCGATLGIGGVATVDTNNANATPVSGTGYVNTSTYHRSDDPLGSDADALTKAASATQMADGTVKAWLNSGANSLGNWGQGVLYPVFGADVTIAGLSLSGDYKTTYNVGDALDLTGLEVAATLGDGTSVAVSGFTTDPAAGSVLATAGTQDVTVTYGQASASFTVTVVSTFSADDVCAIGSTGYTSLGDALAAVQSGQTIKLLSDIDYYAQMSVSGKSITFDTNGFVLNVAPTGPYDDALTVGSGGEVNLIDTSAGGTGEFNCIGSGSGNGVYANSGCKAMVTNAVSAYAGVWVSGASQVTVEGAITAGSSGNGNYIYMSGNKTQDMGVASTTKPGYLEYTDGTGYVWVKDPNAQPAVDKSALQTAIDQANALVASDFTPSSWDTMQAKLILARLVVDDMLATQDVVDSTCANLNDAVASLVQAQLTIKVTAGATIGLYQKNGSQHYTAFTQYPLDKDSAASDDNYDVYVASGLPATGTFHIEAYIQGVTIKQAVAFTQARFGSTITIDLTPLADWVPQDNTYMSADMYTNLDNSGTLNLSTGQTFSLDTFRVWQAVDSVVGNYFIEPDFNYDLYGDSVSIQRIGSAGRQQLEITALKPGTSVIKVTYAPLSYTLSSGTVQDYNGIAPDNTVAVVVNVDANGTVQTGIDTRNDFDVIYFDRTQGSANFTFTPEDGSSVRVHDPLNISDWGDGWTSYTAAADGSYTVQLKDGENIIEVTKGTAVSYYVVKARAIDVTVTNLTNPGEPFSTGDTAQISMTGIESPIQKMAGIYNTQPGYLVYTNGVDTFNSNNSSQYDSLTTTYTVDYTLTDTSLNTLTGQVYGNAIYGGNQYLGSHRSIALSGLGASTVDGTVGGDSTLFGALPVIVLPLAGPVQPAVGAPGSGDPYGTGMVTADVAMLVAQLVTGTYTGTGFTPAQLAAVDMDGDGVLTMTDVMMIMKKATGI